MNKCASKNNLNKTEATFHRSGSFLKGMTSETIVSDGVTRTVSRYVSPYTSFKMIRECIA